MHFILPFKTCSRHWRAIKPSLIWVEVWTATKKRKKIGEQMDKMGKRGESFTTQRVNFVPYKMV